MQIFMEVRICTPVLVRYGKHLTIPTARWHPFQGTRVHHRLSFYLPDFCGWVSSCVTLILGLVT